MKTFTDYSIPWLGYPLVMAVAITLHSLMLGTGIAPAVATYLPVTLAAIIVLVLERTHPYRTHWQPNAAEMRTDLTFMALVQILWPQFIAALFAFSIIDPIHAMNLPITQLWPQDWPVWAQAILMVLLADLLRYWLHRIAHTNATLWRLHAVHHSPERLYGLNVGRFHPFEKALQMTLDPLPFLLLGVSAPVLASYYVLYATNGFFQHCNIRLNYGWLNYLVGSAQTHRWHHARNTADANHNYGNTVIIWDLLFGTWYLPRDREVGPLGISNTAYPRSFSEQLRTPFTPDIAERPVAVWNWTQIFTQSIFWLKMQFARMRFKCQSQFEARFPRWIQGRALNRIIRANCDSRFGRAHQFGEINGLTEYQQRVPIAQYEHLRGAIETQAVDGTPELTSTRPVLYARTSGSTGMPKYLPVIPYALLHYKREQHRFIYDQYTVCPEAFSGSWLVLTGAATEDTWHGHPVGSISGVLTDALPGFVQKLLIIPDVVFSITQPELKLLVILRLALCERDLTYLGSPNPSTFLRLLELAKQHWDLLVNSVEAGQLSGFAELPEAVRALLQRKLHADPLRAAELRRVHAQGTLSYATLWPSIRMITTWSGGSCGIALEALKKTLPDDIVVYELGYLASELRGTFPASGSASGLPTLGEHFFEFIRCDDHEQNIARYFPLEQLQQGERYYIIVTTPNGLYRYFMDDIVEVSGFLYRTPLLRFVQKGKGVCNITGEKLYEGQVIDAVRSINSIVPIFYAMVADEEKLRYDLFIEATAPLSISLEQVAYLIDERLGELNIEYAAKRSSGRLNPLRVWKLAHGTGDKFKAHCTRSMTTGGQYKPRIIHYRKQLPFEFSEHTSTKSDDANGVSPS